jgi:DNA processing protein
LITADFALEEGREVLACPGEITSALSAGTNALLRLGATPLTSSGDVLELFGLEAPAEAEVDLGEAAHAILERLDRPTSADELVRVAGLDAGVAAAALAELELAGLVATSDGVYRRTGR